MLPTRVYEKAYETINNYKKTRRTINITVQIRS